MAKESFVTGVTAKPIPRRPQDSMDQENRIVTEAQLRVRKIHESIVYLRPRLCNNEFSGKQCATPDFATDLPNGRLDHDEPEAPCDYDQHGYFGKQCQFAKEFVIVPRCKKACVNGVK
jgi:hypothetical protein